MFKSYFCFCGVRLRHELWCQEGIYYHRVSSKESNMINVRKCSKNEYEIFLDEFRRGVLTCDSCGKCEGSPYLTMAT